MKSLIQIACRVFDMVAGLTLVGAALSLIYAMSMSEIIQSGLYFDRFFTLLMGAVLFFTLSRVAQLSVVLSRDWSNGGVTGRNTRSVYDAASTVR